MNGLDLATKIRQIKSEIPVILATGFADLPSHSVLDFPRLTKPYSQEDQLNSWKRPYKTIHGSPLALFQSRVDRLGHFPQRACKLRLEIVARRGVDIADVAVSDNLMGAYWGLERSHRIDHG